MIDETYVQGITVKETVSMLVRGQNDQEDAISSLQSRVSYLESLLASHKTDVVMNELQEQRAYLLKSVDRIREDYETEEKVFEHFEEIVFSDHDVVDIFEAGIEDKYRDYQHETVSMCVAAWSAHNDG